MYNLVNQTVFRIVDVIAKAPTKTAPAREQDIVRELRERISTHRIAPGAKLIENDLAEEFKVSRTRVREALTALELRGLITREPKRGAVVSRMDLAEIFAIYDVREALEGMAARQAALNRRPEDWQRWLELLAPEGPLQQLVEQGEVEAYFAHYERLRTDIVEAAANPVLTAMLDGILEKTRIIMRRVQILPGRARQALAEHRAIVEAILAGDAQAAERLRRENIRSAIATLRRFQYFVV